MKKEKNILIIGKNSYISKYLSSSLLSLGNIFYTSSTKENFNNVFYLDLEKPQNFNLPKNINIDYVIFSAAISSPDFCEKNFEKAYQINVKGTSYIIEKFLDSGSKVIFFSSDTVYGNREELVTELSETNPLGNYGKMKLEIEQKFSNNENFKALRLSYVFSNKDKFSQYIISCARLGKRCEIYHPIYRNMVYIKDVSDVIKNLINKWDSLNFKVINVVGNKLLSRVDLVKALNKQIFTNLKYDIVTPPEDFYNARPKMINVNSIYIKDLLGRTQTDIQSILKEEFREVSNG